MIRFHRASSRISAVTRRIYARSLEQLEERALLSIAPFSGIPEWTEQGPGPITFGIASSADTSLYSQAGAIEAVAVHPSNANILYIATVNGGIWKTENAQYSRLDKVDNDFDGFVDEPGELPNWTPLTDGLSGLSMGAIAFDPLDATFQTLYAGAGRFSSTHDGGPRGGLLRTTDGGVTWTELAQTTFQNQNVESIVPTSFTTPTGQVILVATNNFFGSGGVFRSADSGATFTRVSGTGLPPNADATQLVGDPSNNQRFYAGIRGHGVYRSDDAGATWQPMLTGYAGSVRIALAVHWNPVTGTNVVYAAILHFIDRGNDDKGEGLAGLFRSDNFGQSWTTFSYVPNTGYQGSIHFAMLADRNDEHVVYVGGASGNYACDFDSDSWSLISGTGANDTGSHSDHRFFTYDLQGNILDTNDGGIYRLKNPTSSARKWEALNNNLRVTEFYRHIAYDSLNDIIFAGTQDNGTIQQRNPGSIDYQHVTGADGNAVLIGREGGLSYRYVMGNNYHSLERHIYDDHNQLVAIEKVNLAASATPDTHLSGMKLKDQQFKYNAVHPFVVNSSDPTRFLLATGNALYETFNRGNTIADITPGGIDQRVYAIDYGGEQSGVPKPDVIYAGIVTQDVSATPQIWVRTTVAGGFAQLTSYAGSKPVQIKMDPSDWRIAYVLDQNSRIWRTSNAGANWSELTLGNDLLAGKLLRTIEVVRIGGTPILLAGGDGGVYRRISPEVGANSTSWSLFGRDLAHAPVVDLVYDAVAELLIAATVGRGMWTMANAANWLPWVSTLVVNGDLNDYGDYDSPNRADIIRVSVDPNDDRWLVIDVNGSAYTHYRVEHSAVQTIEIYAQGGNDFVQIDSLPEQTVLGIFGGTGRDVIYISSEDVLSNVSMHGDADPDWFLVTPSASAEIFAYGGSPSAPVAEGDVLRVLPDGHAYTITPTGTGQGYVNVTGYDLIRYFETESVAGDGPNWRSDALEVNDDWHFPRDIGNHDHTYLDLTIHQPGNEDWYQWTATQAGTLVAQLYFDHELGDLNLGLYTASGSFLALSDSTTDDESLAWSVVAGQSYLIRVYGYNNATNPNYALEIDWPYGFPDDSLEDNDSFSQARDLGTGDQTHTDLAITPFDEFIEDEDWFRWKATASGLLNVQTVFRHALGDLELELRNSANAVVASSTSSTDNESVSRTVAAGETYYIRVYGWAGSDNPDYDLIIDGPEIQLDRFERNPFDLTEIVDLGAGDQLHTNLSIHESEDVDWYQWRATNAGPLTIDLSFSHALGDLDMRLYDINKSLLRGSYSSTDHEQVTYNVAAGEKYLVEVYGYAGATNADYDLDIHWPFTIAPDPYESNDSLAQAAWLGEGDFTLTELTIHPDGEFTSSEDWYAWRASQQGALHVEARFLDELGDVDLELYEPGGTRLASSASATDNEEVFWDVVPGNLYYIRVFGYQEARHPDYDLIVDGPDLLPDIFEVNNSIDQPRDLGMGNRFYQAMSIHSPYDDDWYQWQTSAIGTVSVDVYFDPGLGDIDLELYNAAGGLLASSNSTSGMEHVAYANAAAGQEMLIRVFGYNGVRNRNYSLEIAGPTIPPDAREPNDSFAEAWNVGGGTLVVSNLSIHEPDNSDWFAWTAPANGTLTADVLFDHDLGDANAELYDGIQNLLASSLTTTDNERLQSPVTGGQTYEVHVFGAIASVAPTILIDPRYPTSVRDLQPHYDLAFTFAPSAMQRADFDLDLDVDGRDFLTWQRGFGHGVTHAEGDADGDEDVDVVDLRIWKEEYGASPAGTALASSVPTQSTLIVADVNRSLLGVTGLDGDAATTTQIALHSALQFGLSVGLPLQQDEVAESILQMSRPRDISPQVADVLATGMQPRQLLHARTLRVLADVKLADDGPTHDEGMLRLCQDAFDTVFAEMGRGLL